ncbi:hypothetical protein OIO90_001484 [Microbotryomycetes sp. JL221]|nr:hypothetical protein OIO90_001484 [Microbotryomycetes sp. JL221]
MTSHSNPRRSRSGVYQQSSLSSVWTVRENGTPSDSIAASSTTSASSSSSFSSSSPSSSSLSRAANQQAHQAASVLEQGSHVPHSIINDRFAKLSKDVVVRIVEELMTATAGVESTTTADDIRHTYKQLTTLARVNKGFNSACRHVMFKHVVVTTNKQAWQLDQLVQNQPHLVRHTSSVRFGNGIANMLEAQDMFQSILKHMTDVKHIVLHMCAAHLPTFSLATQLETLEITRCDIFIEPDTSKQDWWYLPKLKRMFLSNVYFLTTQMQPVDCREMWTPLCLPNLKVLSFKCNRVGDLPSFNPLSGQLKALHLSNQYIPSTQHQQHQSQFSSTKLNSNYFQSWTALEHLSLQLELAEDFQALGSLPLVGRSLSRQRCDDVNKKDYRYDDEQIDSKRTVFADDTDDEEEEQQKQDLSSDDTIKNADSVLQSARHKGIQSLRVWTVRDYDLLKVLRNLKVKLSLQVLDEIDLLWISVPIVVPRLTQRHQTYSNDGFDPHVEIRVSELSEDESGQHGHVKSWLENVCPELI